MSAATRSEVRKSLQLVLICTGSLTENAYAHELVDAHVSLDALFDTR